MINTPTVSAPLVIGVVAAGIALIGWVDFVTGVEIRVLPLYYMPLSLAAWELGRKGAFVAAMVCALTWMVSNYQAGQHYSSSAIWVVNVLMQGTSFVIVGMLIATVRISFLRAEQLSRTDPLTLLLNGRAFADEAGRILAQARRHRRAVTLAYVDLDDFKVVNDTLGHGKGDDALRATADLLRQTLRAGDVIARIGGDEFVVLLPETGPDGAAPLIDRLRLSLTGALRATGCPITASVGAISFIEPPGAVEELLQKADALMYAAKAAGKNCIRLGVVGAS